MSRALMALTLALCLITAALGAATVGQAAPDFTVTDTHGKSVHLAALRGKWVVLEWFNKDCPVSKGKYDDQTMQGLEKKYGPKGVVWITVCSSAPGKQGYCSAQEIDAVLAQRGAKPTEVVLDPSGDLGHLYGAKTTPHMFIVDPRGTLVYNGAIDDQAGHDYVDQALQAGMAGQAISTAVTAPYGCSVKYR